LPISLKLTSEPGKTAGKKSEITYRQYPGHRAQDNNHVRSVVCNISQCVKSRAPDGPPDRELAVCLIVFVRQHFKSPGKKSGKPENLYLFYGSVCRTNESQVVELTPDRKSTRLNSS